MNENEKTTVLLLHGWGGKKEKHWLTWIEKELLSRSYEVYFPKIPNAYNPDLKRWMKHIEGFVQIYKPEIVIAHSLGALAWWHYCETHICQTQNIMVSPPTFDSFSSKMHTFFPLPEFIKKENSETIIYALDDKNIDSEVLEKIALARGSKTMCKKEGEHLDHFSGTDTLSEVLACLSFIV